MHFSRARLFYRSSMKHIKLVAADEPSASLDPQIEYQIFGRLYGLSAELGKTLVSDLLSLFRPLGV